LPLVIDAEDLVRFALGFAQSRQEHRGQQRNDRNDHQQFNQRKTASMSVLLVRSTPH
jgi:hypothetical protein